MTRPLVNQQGFTLLEVLIALALMALLSVISWRALDLTERSSARLNASADDTLALVRVLGQIESDLSRHADGGILPAGSPPDAAGLPAPPQPAAPAPTTPAGALLPPGIHWAEPILAVVRSAHDGAWQQVVWGRDGDMLLRAVGPASYTLPVPEAGEGQVVLDHIRNFTVRAWVPGQGWSAPDSPGTQLAATGLEVTIVREHHGASETYRKVVLLP